MLVSVRRLRSTESRTCVVTRTQASFGGRAFAVDVPGLQAQNQRSTESGSFTFGRNRKQTESDVTHSAETVCATESKEGLSAVKRNRKSIMSGPKPHSPNNKSSYVIKASLSGLTGHSTRCRRRQRSQLPRLSLHSQSVHSEANDYLRLAHSLPPQLKLSTLLSATTEFTNCSMPKPKVHRMQQCAVRLLSAETECAPKMPIFTHSAPKPKPKFGRPLPRTIQATIGSVGH